MATDWGGEVSRLWRVWRTVHQMVHDRVLLPLVMCTNNKGYEVSQAELNISIESFLQNHCKAENPSEIEYLSSFPSL